MCLDVRDLEDRPLPAGRLRERPSALAPRRPRAADADRGRVARPSCARSRRGSAPTRTLPRRAPRGRLAAARRRAAARAARAGVPARRRSRGPERFERDVAGCGVGVVGPRLLPRPPPLPPGGARRAWRRRPAPPGADAIVTTAKDAVRLRGRAVLGAAGAGAGHRGRDRRTRRGCASGCWRSRGGPREARAAPRARGRRRRRRVGGRAPPAAPRRAGPRPPPGPRSGPPSTARHLRDRGRQPAPRLPRVGRGARAGARRAASTRTSATVLLDILWMEGRPVEELLALADVDGRRAPAERALARGPRRRLRPPAHLGNWEFQGVAYGPAGRPRRRWSRARSTTRRSTAASSPSAPRPGTPSSTSRRRSPQVLKTLREGRVVAILIDQNVQAKDGIFVRFFGRPACTTTVAAALALKTGCADRAGALRAASRTGATAWSTARRSSGRARAAATRTSRALTQQLTSIIEGWVRETPEQWLWLHRRWKTQPSSAIARDPVGAESRAISVASRPAPASARDEPSRAPPRPRAELGRRRRAVAARAARPAPRVPGGAARGARAAVGRRALPRPCPRSTRSSRAAGTRADVAAAARRASTSACCCRTRSAPRSSLWRAGIPERWGYATDGRGAAADARAAACPPRVRGRSQVYYYRAMLEGLGLAVEGPPDASLACPEEWAARGRALLGGDGPWIGVNPGAFYGTAKRWPPERFAAAADARGAPHRRAASRSWAPPRSGRSARRSRRSSAAPARVLCGETTLAELVGVLSSLRLLLTNDSGPMHLAAALGTPLVAVFGSTDWTRDGAGLRARRASCARTSSARPACCASARSTTAA